MRLFAIYQYCRAGNDSIGMGFYDAFINSSAIPKIISIYNKFFAIFVSMSSHYKLLWKEGKGDLD